MKRRKFWRLLLWGVGSLAVGAALLAGGAGRRAERSAAPLVRRANDPPAPAEQVRAVIGKLPLYFIENRGQVDSRVAYYVQGKDTTLYFTSEGLTYAFTSKEESGEGVDKASLRRTSFRRERESEEPSRRWVLKLDFVGARSGVRPSGQDLTPALFSYFKGRREDWKTALKTYSKVVYSDLWPGIDLVYSGTVNQLKYTFLVKPGADPDQIRLAYRGATSMRVNGEGQLEVSTPLGGFHDEKPYSYQEVGGRRVEMATAYALEVDQVDGARRYGFRVAAYDRQRPLIIDPVALLYSGYIGGAGDDAGLDIALDNLGNAYVTGDTNSIQATFPVTVGPDLTYGGSVTADAFVAKVNATGTALIYCGYIGGDSHTRGLGIAVDDFGNAYVTGVTNSTEASFPVAVGPDLTYNGGEINVTNDAFVAKVNASGTALVYCGYIGGSSDDEGSDVAVDSVGNAYVIGTTQSTQTTFPVKIGPDSTYNGGGGFLGGGDAFVAKVNAFGEDLLYAGYIGGAGLDFGFGIAVDSLGRAYVTGETESTQASFPVKVGPDLTHNGGGSPSDAFVARVTILGSGLDYCGYIGGSSLDRGFGIAVDHSGNAYVTGETLSDEATFPIKLGPDLTFNGGFDAFVAKVNSFGTELIYCGYIGGERTDEGRDIAVGIFGNAYVIGTTQSDQATFPEKLGPDLTYNGGLDAFVAKLHTSGSGLIYCSYIGGNDADEGRGIAVYSSGQAYLTGSTDSVQGFFPAFVGPDLTHNGDSDAFVVVICDYASHIQAALALLEELLDQGSLNGGQGTSLKSKLEASAQQADRGNVGAAVNQLRAFQFEVEALASAGHLTRPEAESLTVTAQAANNTLEQGCDR